MPSTALQGGHLSLPVNAITADAPWRWVKAGWSDLRAAPQVGLTYGTGTVAAGLAVTVGLWMHDLEALTPIFIGSFFLIGPFLASGLYDTSRRLEQNEPVSLRSALNVQPARRMQLTYMGFALMFVYLAWVRIATLLYAIFAHGHFSPLGDFITHSVTTVNGLSLIASGTAIGACLALFVFAISAVAIPMLLDRPVDFVTAMATSVQAVRKNFAPMMIWAWMICLLVGVGIATLFLGLIVVFPLIGHATWHAYRDLVGSSG